jgi:hypothetical protein
MLLDQYNAAIGSSGLNGVANVDYIRLSGGGRGSNLLNVRGATLTTITTDDVDLLKITLKTGQEEIYALADVVGVISLPTAVTTPYDIWTDVIHNRG